MTDGGRDRKVRADLMRPKQGKKGGEEDARCILSFLPVLRQL